MSWFLDLFASRRRKRRRSSVPSHGRYRRLGLEPLSGSHEPRALRVEPLEERALLSASARVTTFQVDPQIVHGGDRDVPVIEGRIENLAGYLENVKRFRAVTSSAIVKQFDGGANGMHLYIDTDHNGVFEPWERVATKNTLCLGNGWGTLSPTTRQYIGVGGHLDFQITVDLKSPIATSVKSIGFPFKDALVVKSSCQNAVGTSYVKAATTYHLVGADGQLLMDQKFLGTSRFVSPGTSNVDVLELNVRAPGVPVRLQNFTVDVFGGYNANSFSLWTGVGGTVTTLLQTGLTPRNGEIVLSPNLNIGHGVTTLVVRANQIVSSPSGTLSVALDTDDANVVKAKDIDADNRTLQGTKVNGVGIPGADKILTTTSDLVVGFQQPPTVMLFLSSSPMAEAGGVATVTASLSAVSSQNVTVGLSFSGTATLGADYTRSSTQIVIPAGSMNGSISLAAIQDTLVEGNETVVVDIASVTNGTEFGSQQVVAVITDDDNPPQPGANLFVNDVTTTSNLKHLAGNVETIEQLDLYAPGGAVDVRQLSVTLVLGQSESGLQLFANSVQIATANVDVSGPTSYGLRTARTFTATFAPGQLRIPAGSHVVLSTNGVFVQDGIAGEPVMAALASASAISATEVATGLYLANNDNDGTLDGEVVLGRLTAGPNLAVESPEQVIVDAELASAVNADPDANGSPVPIGTQVVIGSFTDTAMVNSNAQNGVDQIKIRQLSFTLYATNVNFDVNTVTVVNSSNIALSASCSVTLVSPGVYSVISYLDTSSVSATISSGGSQTFRLRADVFGKANALLSASLMVAQNFDANFQWHDLDSLTNRILVGADLGPVNSTQYTTA